VGIFRLSFGYAGEVPPKRLSLLILRSPCREPMIPSPNYVIGLVGWPGDTCPFELSFADFGSGLPTRDELVPPSGP